MKKCLLHRMQRPSRGEPFERPALLLRQAAAVILQARVARPSTSTVHAPQMPSSHPTRTLPR